MVLVGRGTPSGVRSAAKRSGALRKFGLKLRMPRRAKVLFMRLMMRVRSPTSVSRSRLGRRASSSSSVGIGHLAVIALAPQPAEKGALQQIDVQAVGFGAVLGLDPGMLARDRNARGMDDMSFDTVRSQPAGQPEAVPAGLEGHCDAPYRAARLGRFAAPALQHLQQLFGVRRQLLQRMAFDPRNNRADQPARLAHLDYGNQRAILVEGGEGPAQVIGLRHWRAPSRVFQRRWCHFLAARPYHLDP